ncbi:MULTISPECIES: ribosomal protein S18-alanine N-acetyltransferase [unclassified Leucobacter]|uniref:ribosomal protein S18-alanine N-acetyltransferase n=1 Tax=unclassified Leucobacter TaxID=2621730 RepID=UPI001F135B66|nr:ribosomal protein S18-alanine N-acetyltransferase [Leucobacter sp. CX169]
MSGRAGDELILRDVTLADLDVLAAMEAELFAGEAWSRDLVRDEITGKHRRYLALEDAATGQIAGYAGLLAVGTEGDVQTIAVAPEYQGQGAGRRLMLELLAAARECGVRELFLEVRADNPVARTLYTSLGFAEIGLRPGYYQPGAIDAVVMRLSPLPPTQNTDTHTEGEGR